MDDVDMKLFNKLEALNPDCLAIKDAEGNVMFNIATSTKECVSKYGIVFANDSKISVLVDAVKVDRDVIEDLFGAILLQLSEVEKKAFDYLEEVATDLDDLIEIVAEEDEEEE